MPAVPIENMEQDRGIPRRTGELECDNSTLPVMEVSLLGGLIPSVERLVMLLLSLGWRSAWLEVWLGAGSGAVCALLVVCIANAVAVRELRRVEICVCGGGGGVV